jgi:hypothetical protein
MNPRTRLTKQELEALLAVAQDADAPAHCECYPTRREGAEVLDAFESALDKLRELLAKREN